MTRKNNLKRFSLLALTLLFSMLIIGNAAASFTAEREIITSRTMPGGFTEYSLTIDNPMDFEQVFEVRLTTADALNWIVSTTPSRVRVPGNSEETFIITLNQRSGTPLGSYSVSIRVISRHDGTTETISVPVIITEDGAPAGFLPSVEMVLDLPESHDPRDQLTLPIRLRNRNQLNITELIITSSSELFETQQRTVSIDPMQERTVYMYFDFDDMQAPGDYDLLVNAYHPPTGRYPSEARATLSIESYTQVDTDYESVSSLFLTTETITMTNNGNFERVSDIELPAPWYKRMFTQTTPEAEVVRIDGKAHYLWSPSLPPGGSYTITVTTNYRLLVIFILIIFLATTAYFVFRSPIIILKEATVIGKDEDGVSEVKIKIFVKNRSGSEVRSLSVNDKLPSIIELSEPHHLGSLKPSKVTKTTRKGTLLYWNLDSLDSLEERVLTYRAKAKLKIIGDITLPRVRAKFESKKGKERIIFSAKPFFVKD